jgi:hypothetical protein
LNVVEFWVVLFLGSQKVILGDIWLGHVLIIDEGRSTLQQPLLPGTSVVQCFPDEVMLVIASVVLGKYIFEA